MRVLMIVDYLPYPPISGGRIRVYNLLRQVARFHAVSLAGFLEKPEDAEGLPHLRELCERVETASFRQRSRLAKVPGLLRFALEGKPPELNLLYSEELVEKINQLVSSLDFDLIQIESTLGFYLESLPKTGRYKTIQMFQNFSLQQYGRVSQIEQRWDSKLRAGLKSLTMGAWEPRYAEKFDCCTAVSEADQDLLLKANPRLQVEVIPNGVDLEQYQPLPLPDEKKAPAILFIGNMGYPPCADAALYFCSEIFPSLRQALSNLELWIVGRDPSPEVLNLEGPGIHVTGRVESVLPYYQQCAVSVVPLRAGGGTRLKILEAMALGRPVVSTTIGCEGLEVVDGQHLLLADTPRQFAEQTLRLLREHELAQALATQGRQLVEARYGWEKIAAHLLKIYAELAAHSNRPAAVDRLGAKP